MAAPARGLSRRLGDERLTGEPISRDLEAAGESIVRMIDERPNLDRSLFTPLVASDQHGHGALGFEHGQLHAGRTAVTVLAQYRL
jgi:hypothetical protein